MAVRTNNYWGITLFCRKRYFLYYSWEFEANCCSCRDLNSPGLHLASRRVILSLRFVDVSFGNECLQPRAISRGRLIPCIARHFGFSLKDCWYTDWPVLCNWKCCEVKVEVYLAFSCKRRSEARLFLWPITFQNVWPGYSSCRPKSMFTITWQ